MPVPMVEPRPIAVSELAVSTRFSGGALSRSAQMASTDRTANRRRRKGHGTSERKRLAVSGWRLCRGDGVIRLAPHRAHSLQGRAGRQKPRRLTATATATASVSSPADGHGRFPSYSEQLLGTAWSVARRRISRLDVARRRHGARAQAPGRRRHQLHRPDRGGRAARVREAPARADRAARALSAHAGPRSQRARIAGAHGAHPRPARQRAARGAVRVRALPRRHRPHRDGGRMSSRAQRHDERRGVRLSAALVEAIAPARAAGRRFPKPPSRSTSCCAGREPRSGRSRAAGSRATLRGRAASVSRSAMRSACWSRRASSMRATLVAAMRERSSLRTGALTATTRAVAESLLASCAHNPEDQMQRYLQWTRTAEAAVPAELKRALGAWQWSRKPNAGTHDPKNLDPHSLPRTLAAALYLRADPQRAIDTAAEVVANDAAVAGRARLVPLVVGAADRCAVRRRQGEARGVQRTGAHAGAQSCAEDAGEESASTQAAARSRTARATRCRRRVRRSPRSRNATTASDALLQVATSQGSPAAAALCGALAGAHYGIDSIPADWRRQLAEDAPLRSLARNLLG